MSTPGKAILHLGLDERGRDTSDTQGVVDFRHGLEIVHHAHINGVLAGRRRRGRQGDLLRHAVLELPLNDGDHRRSAWRRENDGFRWRDFRQEIGEPQFRLGGAA